MLEAETEAKDKSSRPRPRTKFWPRGQLGLEDLTSLVKTERQRPTIITTILELSAILMKRWEWLLHLTMQCSEKDQYQKNQWHKQCKATTPLLDKLSTMHCSPGGWRHGRSPGDGHPETNGSPPVDATYPPATRVMWRYGDWYIAPGEVWRNGDHLWCWIDLTYCDNQPNQTVHLWWSLFATQAVQSGASSTKLVLRAYRGACYE